MKYKILIDYGRYEGLKFWGNIDYDNLDEAVKEAQANTYGNIFYIVKIIDWEATEKKI